MWKKAIDKGNRALRNGPYKCYQEDDHCRAEAMQDWVLISAPLATTCYFLVFQDQFKELLAWLATLIG